LNTAHDIHRLSPVVIALDAIDPHATTASPWQTLVRTAQNACGVRGQQLANEFVFGMLHNLFLSLD
jgi:hypothetical protein